jgi:hypothetical protein
MSRILSRVLRESTYLEAGWSIPRWGFWCPGCRHPHMLPIEKPPGTVDKGPWTFSGDLEAPTISPSVHVKVGELRDPDTGQVLAPASSWCHATITNGRITFLEDSHGHKLRGTHDLPAFPHPELEPPLPRQEAPRLHSGRIWKAVR